MRKIVIIVLLLGTINVFAQSEKDKNAVKKACLNYIEGFYEGDTLKIINSISPSLYKFGYWKNKKTGKYREDGQMTFEQALKYSKGVLKTKKFAPKTAPRKVEILDISNHIASTKITAWWGVDYMLLARKGDKWMIQQVLWEGPLDKKKKKK